MPIRAAGVGRWDGVLDAFSLAAEAGSSVCSTGVWRRCIRIGALAIGVVLLLTVGRAALHLGVTWWQDRARVSAETQAGASDAGGFARAEGAEIFPIADSPVEAEAQLAALVRRAVAEGRTIVVSGARHSMGGHTMLEGALVVDMLGFPGMEYDETCEVLRVQAGARWSEVIPFLDARGRAVAVMQSNNDFTVGGSISVNCHGWQHGSPPIAGTVEAIRLLTADGTVVRCSAMEHAELFGAALGGYGLFGIILEAELRTVSNAWYRARQERTTPERYVKRYRELMAGSDRVGMAYGRISVAPASFLRDAVIVLLEEQPVPEGAALDQTLTGEEPAAIKRLVFRGSVGSDYGKNLRWSLETLIGETGGAVLSRNEVMNDPSSWFANGDPAAVEVLQEYFVPPDRLAEFVARAREILPRHSPDLLNITVRHVLSDTTTRLAYAREECFGLVMLFHIPRTPGGDSALAACAREMINAVLACGGTYYLPYRPHATLEQFGRAYPQAAEFFAMKRRVDPHEVFQNQFYRTYGVEHSLAR